MIRKKSKDTILAGVLLALAVIVPYIFHISGISGPMFLPMHVPVIIGGFFLNPFFAGLLGFISPIINSLVSGMPIMYPIAIIMAFELMVYGLSISILSKKFSIYTSLVIGMVLGRIVAAGTVYALQNIFGLKMNYMIYLQGAIITGIPGIIIQLLIVPVLVKALKKSFR